MGKYEIPQFQRSFIWRESQVRLLIDSIARGYPIGSFLLMNKDDELPLQARPLEAYISLSEDELDDSNDTISEVNSDSHYVLDGQQRITSLTRVFLNANSSKTYYFDIQKIASDGWSEDQDWIFTRSKPKVNKERISSNKMIRSDIVLDQEKSDIYISEYIEDGDDFDNLSKNEKRKLVAKVKGVFENIRNYDVSLITIDATQGLESICRVFETINSTGTRLTTFDLAVARFYPKPDLRALHEASLVKYPILKDYNVEGERFLQVTYLVQACEKGEAHPMPTRSALLSMPKEAIEIYWDAAASGLNETYKWITLNGVTPATLPSTYPTISIATILAVKPDIIKDIDFNFNSRMRQWFYSRMFNTGIGSTNHTIGIDLSGLRESIFNNANLDIKEVRLDTNSLLKLNRNDNRFKAVLCVMALNSQGDILTGEEIGEDAEYHHIFPRALAKSSKIPQTKLENVLNRLAVTKSTNRKLSDKHPSTYMKSLISDATKNGLLLDVKDRLAGLLMPYGVEDANYLDYYSTHNYNDFLEARAGLVMDRLKAVLGNRLLDPIEDDDDDLE